MAAKDLPEDRATLNHLQDYADRLLAALEPVRQQMNHLAGLAADMFDGEFTESEFFGEVSAGLMQSVARGFPPHQALTDYLDSDGAPLPSQVDLQLLHYLNQVVAAGTADEADRGYHLALTLIRIEEISRPIDEFVERVHELHKRIVEKLADAQNEKIDPLAAKPPIKMPVRDAIKAFQLNLVLGSPKQSDLAKALSEELGREIGQGQVSRWLKQVGAFLRAGNVLPDVQPPRREKPVTMDPERLDLGGRHDGRAERQRGRRSDD